MTARQPAPVALKPCPSIGCQGVPVVDEWAGWGVTCSTCGMSGPDHDHDGAKWNALPRRAEPVSNRQPAPVEERHRRAVAEAASPVGKVSREWKDWVRDGWSPGSAGEALQRLAQAIADAERDAERRGHVAGLREGYERGRNMHHWTQIEKRISELEGNET